ncbi:MAG: (d)CMP kinase [Paludibacteraceae bacterium]|nr:(d)CMP kinase [Paludibacteraceae bacterium]
MKKIIIAIDGFSSCGKSTIAKQLAAQIGYTYIDTGAMYRALALFCQQHNVDVNQPQQVVQQLPHISIAFTQTPQGQHVTLNNQDVEHLIRTLEIGNLASQVSTIKQVRQFLVKQQQLMGQQKGIVMDGRDIGSVVFPNAELKLFITASDQVRANRRFLELQQKGLNPNFQDVLKDVQDRDFRDTHRQESPLTQTPDAILIDNSNLNMQQQQQLVLNLYNQKIQQLYGGNR